MDKKDLIEKFQKNWERYWKVKLFEEKGFTRKRCKNCGKFFWTLDLEKEVCGDSSCQNYEFIGNPPTKKKLNYIDTWREIERFFVKKGHVPLRRYPVICRWYPLFFTIAGIVDFYRIENGKLIFEFPANPSIIPQICLRFNDVENVGINGRSYTCFCMIQQSSLYKEGGYWKDKCIELDYELLTKVFGIKPKEITFVEDAWLGEGAFGTSLEYFVRGLELGNAVFTEFRGTPDSYTEMEEKVIDMGAGLERFAWITQGTPTSYDVTFKPVLEKLKKETGVEFPQILYQYAPLAARFNIDGLLPSQVKLLKKQVAKRLKFSVDDLEKAVSPLEALYAIADHTRALTFAISDGGTPSNVGGGYNLRVILRRALQFIDKFGWDLDLVEVCGWHAKHLKPLFPELLEHQEEIKKILEVEEKRYKKTKQKTKEIVKKLKRERKKIGEEELIELYDSKGITPELLKEEGLEIEIPPKFYIKVTERHMSEKPVKAKPRFDISGLPKTRLLYYEDPNLLEFEAKVLKILDNHVILDQTIFYPRGGGQEPDSGLINGCRVIDVNKIKDVVIHELEKIDFREGQGVICKVDKQRREILKKHHTATHIINYASRKILGNHIWQHSAFKDVDKARLDITHYEGLSDQEVKQIENLANKIVEKDLPVQIEWLSRPIAEEKYGFRLYQGGVPGKEVRVVSIGEDHEACGGLHCRSTGEVGFITILRTKRIQDGVDRLEFVAGELTLNYLKESAEILKKAADLLKVKEREVPKAVENLFKKWKKLRKEVKIKYG